MSVEESALKSRVETLLEELRRETERRKEAQLMCDQYARQAQKLEREKTQMQDGLRAKMEAVLNGYPMTTEQSQRIENNFRYHAPDSDQTRRYEVIRDIYRNVALKLVNLCPESRELSLALTDLESSVMWANASIARNENPAQ